MPNQRALATVQILWLRRRAFRHALPAGILLSAIVTAVLPNRYESTAKLMPSGDLPELKILQSRTIQDEIIREFRLQGIYHDRRLEDARIDLNKRTAILEDRKSGIITLTVADRNARRATAIASDYIDQLNRTALQMQQARARVERIFFQQELSRITAELKTAETNAAGFSSGTMVVDAPEEIATAIRGYQQFQVKLASQRSELRSLRSTYADGSPEIRVKAAEIAALNEQSAILIGKDSSNGQTIGPPAAYPPFRDIPALASRYDDLNRLVALKQETAMELNEKYQNALLKEESTLPLVKVLDFPSVPEGRAWQLDFLMIFLGTCASILLFSMGVIFVFKLQQRGEQQLTPTQSA